jgi:hypothetical protein
MHVLLQSLPTNTKYIQLSKLYLHNKMQRMNSVGTEAACPGVIKKERLGF